MSADNFIRIKEYQESPKFRVSEQCASAEEYEDEDFYTTDYLEEAVKIATKYEEDEYVEYGISIKLLNKN